MGSTTPEAAARRLRKWWFCRVHELADIELQRRTWLDPANLNPHWSYIEFVESYPASDQLQEALNRGWLTREEFDLLDELGALVFSHQAPGGDDYDNAAVLADPAWQAVVNAAAKAQQRLLSMTEDRGERATLSGKP